MLGYADYQHLAVYSCYAEVLVKINLNENQTRLTNISGPSIGI